MLQTLVSANEKKEYNDNDIHSVNVIGDMLTTINQKVDKNDLKSFKEYIEKDNKLKNYTTDVKYGYNITMNLYKNDLSGLFSIDIASTKGKNCLRSMVSFLFFSLLLRIV